MMTKPKMTISTMCRPSWRRGEREARKVSSVTNSACANSWGCLLYSHMTTTMVISEGDNQVVKRQQGRAVSSSSAATVDSGQVSKKMEV